MTDEIIIEQLALIGPTPMDKTDITTTIYIAGKAMSGPLDDEDRELGILLLEKYGNATQKQKS